MASNFDQTWLTQSQMDDTQLSSLSFRPRTHLARSVYYPACGKDAGPIKFLGSRYQSFLYTDYKYAHDIDEIHSLLAADDTFRGYSQIASRRLLTEEFVPGGWGERSPEQDQRCPHPILARQDPAAVWAIFQRDADVGADHGPERFSLIYAVADGIDTYRGIYLQSGFAPAVLAVIQPGIAFGGNYTDFEDPEGLFATTVRQGSLPTYLMHGGYNANMNQSCWPDDYSTFVDTYHNNRLNVLWGRRPS